MKRLGLDMGSSSNGWVLREDNKIIQNGVIIFQSGMVKGQGGYSSPTKDRREARSKRNLIKSRKYRKWKLLEILLNEFAPLDKAELENWSKYKKLNVQRFPENKEFLEWLACDFTYEHRKKYKNPYQLRVRALDSKLSKHEFGRALYHLVQRRGYKDIGESDKETEKQIQRRGESGFQKALDQNRTIAEALTKEFLDKGERARNQYPYREEYENELIQICHAQGYDTAKNEKGEYNNDFIQKLWKAIIWQQPLKSQKGNIGKCTLEPTKPRCPVSHPIFEIFRAWSFINTIKYYDDNGKKQNIGQKERDLLFEFFMKKDKNFKFEEIRSFLDKQFNSKKKYNYPINKDGDYDTSVSGMPVCKGLVGVFGDDIRKGISAIQSHHIGNAPKIIHHYSLYDLWHILFEFDEQHLKIFAVKKLKIPDEKNKKGESFNPFSKLKSNILTGYADLSLKAMCKIIPFLQEGYLYNEAVVLAKVPELLGEKWHEEKSKIRSIIQDANDTYNWHKTKVGITNNLIDQYKGLENDEIFAYKNFQYQLDDSDLTDVQRACTGYFGEKSWNEKEEAKQKQIHSIIKGYYQAFFHDPKRGYREVPLLTNIFKEKLKESEIEINGTLYHHSKTENKYLERCINSKTGTIQLPVYRYKNTGVEIKILPEPRIDSIKNPMFNKSMSILRKLLNELIKNGTIDEDTEVIIEVARELNDNNKRAAIERYQNLRRDNREKYRAFLAEFKVREKHHINIEEGIATFELWTEQTFEESENEKKQKIRNKNNSEILKVKDATKRYELWMEQKGQCLYTGKMISISQLFSNEIDIEHTIPRSLLPDSTMANQTVAYAWYNRDKKKNQLPKHCNNYYEDKEGWGTGIEPRLEVWIKKRANFKALYEDRLKPKRNEDEESKTKRIQERHYFKLHYDYWHDKLERFTAEEVKDSWARRQLVDTQMVSKYAREFLKTYFKKVAVQKGSITADFRKIYGFQEVDEIKSRNRHTHHAIDAAVLTLIPVNSSYRDRLLKEYYQAVENFQEIRNREPFKGFNSQTVIQNIENNTLIVNYEKEKILKQTYKNVRKRGKLQYLKDKKGNFILDKNVNNILLKANGDTVRSSLFAQTYLGKIKDVERYSDGQPKREGDDWKYKTGKDEFVFVKRENIDKVKASDKLIEAIVDPVIKKMINDQKHNSVVKDYQGNPMRHVRINTSVGKEVKERVNYRSNHDYKNKFYSEAGSFPYAILLQRVNKGTVEREMIPVASFEIAKSYKQSGKFDIDQYIHPTFADYPNKKLLKVGQKVIVMNNDNEYEKRKNIDFQTKRLYVITQFSEGCIWLKYHLEAQSKDEIKDTISNVKDNLLRKHEIAFGIPKITEDLTIQDNKKRKEDYENKRFRFDTINNSYRLKRLFEKIGLERTKEIKKELDKFKAISGTIKIDGDTPLLKMSREKWNFLFENEDFNISLLGKMEWVK